ncbi:MAG: [protein-PII] uridylyltransferase [Candidatus Tectomicrobia bacterium]|uniref:Bifunctional uridylyltransferase/uridylyl-removing enzyme n=1 Tax=Tectimicrobiota bacterium TaxID=2528274 RepID=A0A932CME9_UNCTE|nr:[protein-PII] uridylyltransferase [Candidatus Tectomicrobia bacterium]
MEDQEKDSQRYLRDALRHPGERMRGIQRYRERMAEEKGRIEQRHRAGGGGQEIARQHAGLVDKALKDIYAAVLERLWDAHGALGEDPALVLVAQGGYGRGELNPYSDVDILFVCPQVTPRVDEAIQEILCLLYDMGFEVGHRCYAIAEDHHLDALDVATKTAMVESRHLVGGKRVFEQFHQTLRRELFGREVSVFIRQKIQEREERYALYQNSTHLLEPNVKEGPGGLRDYHTVLWLTKASSPGNPEGLWEEGRLPTFWRPRVLEAYDFLLRVRSEMHYACKKRNDVLRFYLQEKVASGLGYQDGDRLSAVEAFMKDYYRNARILAEFSHWMIRHYPVEKRGQRAVDTKELDHGCFAVDGEIQIREEIGDLVRQDPLWLMRIFGLIEEDLRLSEEARHRIRAHLSLIDETYRRDPEVSRLFLSILKKERSAVALRQMHEVGVLGRYLPEFEAITGLAQYDIYHQYTIDEHSLRGIEQLEALPHIDQKELKELVAIYQGLSHPEIVKLALLFHDVGKGEGGPPAEGTTPGAQHSEKGARLARLALDRMGLSEKTREKVELLVSQHILMSHTAQRRDMHDKETIRQFAEAVKNVDNLQRLYLLTYSDMQAVGPGVWTEWKGALIWELYHKGRDHLSRGPQEELTGEARIARIKEEVLEELLDQEEAEITEDYFQAMPYKYILSTTAERIAAHIRLIWKLNASHGKLAFSYTHNLKVRYSEMMVCTADKPGIFSQIAGTLTSKNINILGAQIFTRKDRIAIDTLQVATVEGAPLLEPDLWEEIEQDLREIIEGKKRVEDLVGRRRWIRRPINAVGTRIEIDNKISDTHTIIEIFTQDRLGLLYDITCVLHHLGIDIYLAKISTEANRAVDVFYVTDLEGKRILAEDRVEQIREKLSEVLADPQ